MIPSTYSIGSAYIEILGFTEGEFKKGKFSISDFTGCTDWQIRKIWEESLQRISQQIEVHELGILIPPNPNWQIMRFSPQKSIRFTISDEESVKESTDVCLVKKMKWDPFYKEIEICKIRTIAKIKKLESEGKIGQLTKEAAEKGQLKSIMEILFRSCSDKIEKGLEESVFLEEAVILAAKAGHLNIVKLLTQSIKISTKSLALAALESARNGHFAILDYLIQKEKIFEWLVSEDLYIGYFTAFLRLRCLSVPIDHPELLKESIGIKYSNLVFFDRLLNFRPFPIEHSKIATAFSLTCGHGYQSVMERFLIRGLNQLENEEWDWALSESIRRQQLLITKKLLEYKKFDQKKIEKILVRYRYLEKENPLLMKEFKRILGVQKSDFCCVVS